MYCRSFSTLGSLLKIRTGPYPHPLARDRTGILARGITEKSNVDAREPLERSLMLVVRPRRPSSPTNPSIQTSVLLYHHPPYDRIRPNVPQQYTTRCAVCTVVPSLLSAALCCKCPRGHALTRKPAAGTWILPRGPVPRSNMTWTCVNPLTPQVCPSVSAQKK